MNYDLLREESAVLSASAEDIRRICRNINKDNKKISEITERLVSNSYRLEKLAELIIKYAEKKEETENDILSFMRGRLSVNDSSSMIGDIIIEKDMPYAGSPAFLNNTLIHSSEMKEAVFRKLISDCGEENE